ncbi:MAG: 4Fe-4S dicluster domain-containing protein [Deltaproteobacteria bacterium]|nr:4Fe-4S dicluster domain-containing protein [Deltaproteobacteria bacterium]
MAIDLEKCTGCQTCSVVCKMENTNLPGEDWNLVNFFVEGEYPSMRLAWYPRPCMHCEKPSCLAVCPVSATYKRTDGLVLIDWNKCIGCRYCIMACPYGARYFPDEKAKVKPDLKDTYEGRRNKLWDPPYQMLEIEQDARRGVGVPPKGVVTKCTFCAHRLDKISHTPDRNPVEDREFTPACVVGCPSSARHFGDIDDPDSKIRKKMVERPGFRLKDYLGNRPQVYYLTNVGGVPDDRKKIGTIRQRKD